MSGRIMLRKLYTRMPRATSLSGFHATASAGVPAAAITTLELTSSIRVLKPTHLDSPSAEGVKRAFSSGPCPKNWEARMAAIKAQVAAEMAPYIAEKEAERAALRAKYKAWEEKIAADAADLDKFMMLIAGMSGISVGCFIYDPLSSHFRRSSFNDSSGSCKSCSK